MRTTFFSMLMALLVSCLGCGNSADSVDKPARLGPAEPGDTESKLPQHPDGNFVLFVSNQSRTPNPVDITISIDGRKAIEAEFDNTGTRVFQHNWVKHQFSLRPGSHTMTVTSRNGHASIKKTFEIVDRHWAVVNYWASDAAAATQSMSSGFTFAIQDKPIGFQ